MRIAQVAPLCESVPPKLYGGTERVVSYLTEELVRLGHDVTLFASGDSITTARLESICDQALRLNKGVLPSRRAINDAFTDGAGDGKWQALRHHSFSSRSSGLPPRAAESDPDGDHIPWSARSARTAAGVS